jgi:transposase-like protein
MSEKFDFEAALKAIQSGQSTIGKDGVLAPLVKQLTEAALEGEPDLHLAEAEAVLDERKLLWGEKCPIVITSWRSKWRHLSAHFKYSEDIRRIIYTTISIEAVHRQFRKLIKTQGGAPNDDSRLKLLCMGIINASKKWIMPIRSWNLTVSQLSIFF